MHDVFYIGTKPNLFPHERAVASIAEAQQLSRTSFCWVVTYLADYSGWDWLWVPPPWQADQCHAWPSQWQKDSGTYLVPKHAYTDVNYHSTPQIPRRANRESWIIPDYIDSDSFDFSWHPDPTEPDYEYHFGTQWQSAGGPIYPGTAGTKFVEYPRACAKPQRDYWQIHESIDEGSWDWSWHPNPFDPAMTYVWGNQWWPSVLKTSISYTVPGATETSYQESPRTRRLPDAEQFEVVLPLADFDFSWEPNPTDPPMIYVWGNQWNPAELEPTVIYRAGGTTVKYMQEPPATVAPDMTNWTVLDDIEGFDYSWRPNPTSPPYRYVFGNQWLTPEQRPAVCYTVPGATQDKYMTEPRARRRSRPEEFETRYTCDFDYSWEPDPGSPAYIYVFGNQWHSAEIMPTVEYHVAGATERKYMTEPRAQLHEQDSTRWHLLVDCEWDRSWHPDPGDPPYIYVFGNQWHSAEVMPTVEYHMPGATERKYMAEPRARLPADMEPWIYDDNIDIDNVDFSWVPDPGSPPYIYHFGTEYQTSTGLTYVVPGATEIKFAGDVPRINQAQPAVTVPDIFYMDRSNTLSQARLERLQARYPNVQRIRYVNSVMDTLRRCAARTRNTRFWVISSHNVYDNFDFGWHPETWQSSMTHVFGSQWNKWSDTFLINRWEFERHSRWAQDLSEFPNLNFVQDQQVLAPPDAIPIYVIDHGNYTGPNLRPEHSIRKVTRFYNSYLETLRRILNDVEEEHCWIISTVCNYQDFDFSWQPEPWQRDMLHVFPSGRQRFGDTFYVPVHALREEINQLERLEWFDVHYCADQHVDRCLLPVIQHHNDCHVNQVKLADFVGPLAIFTNTKEVEPLQECSDIVSLWTPDSRSIVPLDAGAERVLVPREAAVHIRTQLYDYPYIDTQHRIFQNRPMDIVFISHGELCADRNYKALLNTEQIQAGFGHGRIHRIDGVTGRVAAYQAAARISTTPWFFAVFAKIRANSTFDWSWQPDRMQEPKHYIFHAYNPVTNLTYGHQAVIAYNRELVLANTAPGLDFTLDQPHEVVPINSGIATYTETAWMAWRTAFREAIKLRHSLPDVENQYRLNRWLESDNYHNGEWSRYGAQDAMEYYDSVNGEFEQLKKSYEWSWLASYALLRRNLTPDQ